MFRSTLLFIVLIGAVSCNVEIVENINDYLRANPEAKLVQLTRDLASDGIPYSVGRRSSGDSLVGSATTDQTYQSSQNVTATLNYPQTGVGAEITQIQILLEVAQGSIPQLFIDNGGIGQRFFRLIIEASNTNVFRYQVLAYGLP